MLIDLGIILLAVSAAVRGREVGFIQQLCSTAGFFGGLFLGAWLEPHTVTLAQHGAASRTIVTLTTTLGCAIILLIIGDYLGRKLKQRVMANPLNAFDNGLGAGLGILSLLFSVWLVAALLASAPFPSLQSALQNSRIVSALDDALPAAPNVIAGLGRLIDPNGFPQVFVGSEPSLTQTTNLPSLGSLQTAVAQDAKSVVKVEGQGCGGIVEGSGFVAASNLVATNAHVVAGITHPVVQDANGTHRATVIWFDPNLDFAVLRVSNLAGPPLSISTARIANGTPAAALGYPGGGPFTASPAAVINQFTATGRNIYGSGNTTRSVYALNADIIPGNSGGPLVAEDGSVIGVIFAESTTYQHVGYGLATTPIVGELHQAAAQNQAVNTGACAE